MGISKWLAVTILVGVGVVGSACAEGTADTAATEGKVSGDKALDVTREAGEKAEDSTRNIAEKTADKTKEIASATARKTGDAVSATGEAITDGWITTKVSAKFVDETLLKGSDINVDTDDHVVTLKGTVRSDAAKARAAAVAQSTEGVTRVVNQLLVKLN